MDNCTKCKRLEKELKETKEKLHKESVERLTAERQRDAALSVLRIYRSKGRSI